jgi:phosphohistidine phosphatase SixA
VGGGGAFRLPFVRKAGLAGAAPPRIGGYSSIRRGPRVSCLPATPVARVAAEPAPMTPRTRDDFPVIVCVVRHGHAGGHASDPGRDRARRLTAKGRSQAERAGRALGRLRLGPDAVLTSHLPRAAETASLARRACGADETPTVRSEALEPDARPEETDRAVSAAKREHRRRARGERTSPFVAWVVGHDPHLSRLVAHWIGAPASAVPLGKGALAVVAFATAAPSRAGGRLLFLAQPRQARRILRRRRSDPAR